MPCCWLLDGDESMGGTKQPYDPRIHFVLIRDAYLDANPGNQALADWLDAALATFDDVYSPIAPAFSKDTPSSKRQLSLGAPSFDCIKLKGVADYRAPFLFLWRNTNEADTCLRQIGHPFKSLS